MRKHREFGLSRVPTEFFDKFEDVARRVLELVRSSAALSEVVAAFEQEFDDFTWDEREVQPGKVIVRWRESRDFTEIPAPRLKREKESQHDDGAWDVLNGMWQVSVRYKTASGKKLARGDLEVAAKKYLANRDVDYEDSGEPLDPDREWCSRVEALVVADPNLMKKEIDVQLREKYGSSIRSATLSVILDGLRKRKKYNRPARRRRK